MPFSPYDVGNFVSAYVLELADVSSPDFVAAAPEGYARIAFRNGQILVSASGGPFLPISGGSVSGATALNVALAGAIDGINTTFTSPTAFSQISVFLNGVRQLNPGDYVIVNPTTIQTSLAPTGGVLSRMCSIAISFCSNSRI